VRRATAELIEERARFDEDNQRPVPARATVARLALYDADVARRYAAPVHLRVTTTPPAELRLYRYNRDDHYRLEPLAVAGTSLDGTFAPGSYLVTAAAPGRADVRAPILLERGRDEALALALPAAAVPPGFVYVPAGSFLFGAAGDENMRREFYRTVPLHARHTPAYLIGRNETTWAEWIEFLEALPPKERVKRSPKLTAGGFHGSVALESTPEGWHLRFQVTTREYQASGGEKIVYESRTTAAAQDWLRFPASGIAWDDVLAYTRWLATSGRVPGARPCREDEWERAARGADGRAFPHGDELEPGDANWEATYGKQPLAFGPDEVGLHPASNSPYGLADAAGNVWEWTQSVLKPGELVARGGSFYFATPSARSANRETVEPTLRDITVGVRVCADPAR
jgi:formylglycine-generating enzyme required for sulfatase activity